MPIVTLPFAELVDRFGPVPDGVELDVWDLEAPYPRADEVAVTLLPFYFQGRHRWQYVHDLPNLQLLQLPSAGYEHAVPHVPGHAQLANGRGIHDDETAELAVGLALTSLRELGQFQFDRAKGVWDVRQTRSLADRRVTVVGYGAIGGAIATRFEAFKTEVTVVARTAREQDGRHVHAFSELPELARTTDVLVLITPLTDETERLVDADLLAALPDGALVVNVARGKVVDTDALVAELSSGRLSAGLDVTDPEPLPEGHPLWTTPNTVLTPHVGGNTDLSVPRSIELMRRQVAALAEGRAFENLIEV
ncbi:phosphoglycerate dehydrogenase-like enzyme [Curtobacterium sp. PhB130]|uniref:2-hydroxyacid dehydrogenase n=1 Tax=unclassified Curtobacterium TaxID=257496 RepID=UPI000F4CE96F|nr:MULTISPECIES: 2-hydroxyacid dehydrogenase [unclassified Curtobacterium]ROS78368.1 phosphoglycerate dehydrogenase-like enzyme [Curtobacterium sp. PhB130]TCK65314.1 phosphoglycerate dehydrogenase-like enzyme [Curtobacterium sp. PhB136]